MLKSYASNVQFYKLLYKVNKTDTSINTLYGPIKNSGGRSKGTIVAPRIKHRYRRNYRYIDFKRNAFPELPAIVLQAIYDPFRTCRINLICYPIGLFSYILAPSKLYMGDCIRNNTTTPFKYGDSSEINNISSGRLIHNIRGKFARSAGSSIMLVRKDLDQALLKLKSAELRFMHTNNIATVGALGQEDNIHSQIGSAGRGAYMKKRRPRSRPSAMNPVDHPLGGRTRGGVQPMNSKGKITLNRPTVKQRNPYILFSKRQLKLKR